MCVGESEVERQSLPDELVLEEVDPEDRVGGSGDPTDSSKKGVLTDERQLALEVRLGQSAVDRQSLQEGFVFSKKRTQNTMMTVLATHLLQTTTRILKNIGWHSLDDSGDRTLRQNKRKLEVLCVKAGKTCACN